MKDDVRWGILGTAHIAERAFLPGLREAGGGRPVAVASRTADAAEAFAREHGVERAVAGYEALLADPEIDAVYVPLPNALHRAWTEAALEAGKAVLCEKPLCATVEDTEAVLNAVRHTGGLLWEAFVFPFHHQMARVRELLEDGTVGELREIQSDFHFLLTNPANIRLSGELQGGSLQDVGCYPVRLARLLFDAEPSDGTASAVWSDDGVDVEMGGQLVFPGERRLLFSCGFRRELDTFSRLLCTGGRIHLTNAFHPEATDTIEVFAGDERHVEKAATEEWSFTAAIRHVHAVLRELTPTRAVPVTPCQLAGALTAGPVWARVRAAAGTTLVASAAPLSDRSGSAVADIACALSLMVPGTSGTTPTVSRTLPCGPTVPALQAMTVSATSQFPCETSRDVGVTSSGSCSQKRTLSAVAGPAFRTVTTYVNG
jgi:predicted dehydrogenase